jgi:cytochrome c heme-lyase
VEEESEPLPTHDSAAQALGTGRQSSSIHMSPMSSEGDNQQASKGTWTYPSERMLYNALRRKGYEPDAEDIGPMLLIHNHLNEQVWQEVRAWEHVRHSACEHISLHHFHGRAADPSPKAYILHSLLRWSPKPFDRHDWYVQRCNGRIARYVIDYYPGRTDTDFYCDIRPALDTLPDAWLRLKGLLFPPKTQNEPERQ